MYPEKITKADKRMVNDPASKKDYSRIEIIFALMYFIMKIICFILFMYQMKNVWIYC